MNQKQLFALLYKRMKHYPIHSQSSNENPQFIAKLFDIAGSGTWYISEYDHAFHVGYGFVTWLNVDEWGYIDIQELSEIKFHNIPRIELDQFFIPQDSKNVIEKIGRE